MRRSSSIASLCVASLVAAVAFACGESLDTSSDDPEPPVRDASSEAASEDVDGGAIVDAAAPRCRLDAPFDPPVALAALNSDANDSLPRLTDDEMTIVFSSDRNDASTRVFYVATRTARDAAFGAPTPLADFRDGDHDPMISGNGLRFFFASPYRTETVRKDDIYLRERAMADAGFGDAQLLGEPNGDDGEFQPFERAGGLWFTSIRNSGTRDIYFAARVGATYTPALLLTDISVKFAANDQNPVPSDDGLTIYFASDRVLDASADPPANDDIWVARRAVTTESFGSAVRVDELSTGGSDLPGWLSKDGCRLYFTTDKDGNDDIYVAEKPKQ